MQSESKCIIERVFLVNTSFMLMLNGLSFYYMPIHSIVESPTLSIGFDEENRWLYAEWKGSHNQESIQAGCLQLLDTIRAWPCQKLLNDNSGITHISMQLTNFGLRWLTSMRQAGMQYLAWVLPDGLPGLRAVEATLQSIEHPHVATFDDVASGYRWLQLQQRVPLSAHGLTPDLPR